MAIETLSDILEQIADQVGVYGEDRSVFVGDLDERIRDAVQTEAVLNQQYIDQHWRELAMRMEKAFEKYEQHDSQ